MTEAVRLNGGIAPLAIHAAPGDLDDVQDGISAAVGPGDLSQIAFPAEDQCND